jgi:hypothetical protein
MKNITILLNILIKLKYLIIITCAFVFINNLKAQSPLCSSAGGNQTYEWVTRVKISDGEQSSTKSGYTDYTSSAIATLTAGSTYSIEVDVATDGTQYMEYVKIWFDMNQNDTIEDPNELVFNLGKNVQTLGTFTGTVTIPSTCYSGHIYARVIMQYSSTPSLCGTYTYGETEDYLVNVIGGTTNPENKTLTVALAGTGTGTIISSPSGINTESGVKSFDFTQNEVVTLTASPSNGSSFTGWTGDYTSSNSSINVTLSDNKSVTANFDLTVSNLSNGISSAENAVTIYPNPITDKLFIKNNGELLDIKIYSTVGNLIYTSLTKDKFLNLSNLAPGLYIIIINSNQYKFIKI